jgi:L-ribulose-5-phosphate 3-epimerase
VIHTVQHPGCGTLPDFGNFRIADKIWYDRYKGTEELMPFAKGVSAKSHEFDDAGNETKTDYRKMLPIVLSYGYRGWIGVEYEGSKHSEADGIKLTKTLLETVRTELT